jgi:TRAP-type mannitol/chloroaromatic compound transport system permease small subunit
VKSLLLLTMPVVAFVDRLSTWIGYGLRWLVFAAVLLSAGNAIVRKVFSTSSNALLEGQWYLFSAVTSKQENNPKTIVNVRLPLIPRSGNQP